MKPTYEELEREISAYEATVANLEQNVERLAAENAALKQIFDSVTDLGNEPQYHPEGMGCGLEDRGITDRYAAMEYGWNEAMERVYGEVIPSAEEFEFPATDAAIAEVRARGAEALTDRLQQLLDEGNFAGNEVAVMAGAIHCGRDMAQQMRAEASK